MDIWHPKFNKAKHKDTLLYGTVIALTGYRKWCVVWDDGYNEDGECSYSSSVLIIHDGDGNGFDPEEIIF